MNLANVYLQRGELRTALAFAEKALALAESLGDPFRLGFGYHVTGQVHHYLGDLGAARRHLEKGLAVYHPARDRVKAGRFGADTCMACYALLSPVHWAQGFPDEALRDAEEAIAAGRAAAHPLSEIWAVTVAAIPHQLRSEAARCLERAEAALALATEQVLPFWAAYAMVFSGWALVREGVAEIGLARLRAGINAYRATGTEVRGPEWLALLADACLSAGRIEEGLSAVRDALAKVEKTEARYYEMEMHRLEGELLLASEAPDESRAEASFHKAIAIARAQQAKSFELRAATSLARLFARQGKRDEAHALLAPVYDWFTEGFDTADLTAAKALLAQLAP